MSAFAKSDGKCSWCGWPFESAGCRQLHRYVIEDVIPAAIGVWAGKREAARALRLLKKGEVPHPRWDSLLAEVVCLSS